MIKSTQGLLKETLREQKSFTKTEVERIKILVAEEFKSTQGLPKETLSEQKGWDNYTFQRADSQYFENVNGVPYI